MSMPESHSGLVPHPQWVTAALPRTHQASETGNLTIGEAELALAFAQVGLDAHLVFCALDWEEAAVERYRVLDVTDMDNGVERGACDCTYMCIRKRCVA